MNFLFNILILLSFLHFSLFAMESETQAGTDLSDDCKENIVPENGLQGELIKPNFECFINIEMDIKQLQDAFNAFNARRKRKKQFADSKPNKKPQFILTSTPLLKILNPKVTLLIKGPDGQEEWVDAPIITSGSFGFTNGWKTWLDPMAAQSSVCFNCDSNDIKEFTDRFVLRLKEKNIIRIEKILGRIIVKIHEEIERLRPALAFQEGDTMVCRHFAALTLPVVSHLFTHKDFPFNGTIHYVGADYLNNKLEYANDGHAWNFVQVSNGTQNLSAVFDVFQKWFVIIYSPTEPLKEMTTYYVSTENKSMTARDLVTSKYIYDVVNCTKKRFLGAVPTNRRNNCDSLRKNLSLEFACAVEQPKAFTQIQTE